MLCCIMKHMSTRVRRVEHSHLPSPATDARNGIITRFGLQGASDTTCSPGAQIDVFERHQSTAVHDLGKSHSADVGKNRNAPLLIIGLLIIDPSAVVCMARYKECRRIGRVSTRSSLSHPRLAVGSMVRPRPDVTVGAVRAKFAEEGPKCCSSRNRQRLVPL
jgi:hypothetical protein